MDFESYGCFDVERATAFLIIIMDGTKKTHRNAMDRVGLILVSVLRIGPKIKKLYKILNRYY
jgi:hypothetical protein